MGAPGAADYLGVTLRTLYTFIDRGLIPAYKLGRVIRLRAEDVDAFLESQRIAPGSLRHLYPPYTVDETQDHGGPRSLAALTVSLPQAAKILGLSRSDAYRRARSGELAPGVQVLALGPRLNRVFKTQLEQYLARQEPDPS